MKFKNLFSLRTKSFVTLIIGLALACFTCWIVFTCGTWAIEKFYMNDEAASQRMNAYQSSFAQYVKSNSLSTKNVKQISNWVKRKKIYLIIFDDNESIYESGWWSNKSTLFDENEATATMEMLSEYGEAYYSVEFTDATYVVSITDYSEMDWYNGVKAVSAITFFLTILIVLLLYNHYIIKHIMQLSREVLLIDQGKMNQNINCKGSDEIALLASNVDNMRNSIISRFQSEKKAWETNSELITSMSHDIRTPLTSLIGYLDILESKDYQSEEQLEKYIKICKEKSVQLKDLSDKLFQYFFVFGKKDLAMLSETYDVPVLLQQLLGEHVVNLQINGYEVETKFTMKPCKITVDIHYLQRLFDNLFSNIMKYADPNEKVLITANVSGNDLFVYLSNNIRKDNHNMESTNIGLKTCEKIVKQMKGAFVIRKDKNQFDVRIILPVQIEDKNHGDN